MASQANGMQKEGSGKRHNKWRFVRMSWESRFPSGNIQRQNKTRSETDLTQQTEKQTCNSPVRFPAPLSGSWSWSNSFSVSFQTNFGSPSNQNRRKSDSVR
jgi:hypothetical protein